MTNTIITFDGKTYQLIKDADMTNKGDTAIYEAPAIDTADKPDEYGTVPAWSIIWSILDDCDPDWDSPDDVLPYGGTHNQGSYQFSTGRII